MPEAIANSVLDPTTTLSTTITNVSTTIVVASASEMPSTGSFRILIWDGTNDSTKEVIKIASRSGTTLTVDTRAVEGPNIAQAHTAGDPIELVLTAAGLNTYLNEHWAISTLGYITAR